VPDGDGEVGFHDSAIDLHDVAERGPAQIHHLLRVFGVVVDDVLLRNSTDRVITQVVDELVATVLAVQPDGADQPDIVRPDASLLQLIEDERKCRLAVRRGLCPALDPVRKSNGDR